MACVWPVPPLGPPVCGGITTNAAPSTHAVELSPGEILVVDACAVANATITGDAQTAYCGVSGMWAVTDTPGAHTLRIDGVGILQHAVAQGAIPADLRALTNSTGRTSATALVASTLTLCTPASTTGQASIVVSKAAVVAPSFTLSRVTLGRASFALSKTASDAQLAASMVGNIGTGTILFRPGGPSPAPANVTVFWPGENASIIAPGVCVPINSHHPCVVF